MQAIHISTSETAYSAEEIDICLDKVLSHKDNHFTRNELEWYISSGNGLKLFEIYKDLYNEYFHEVRSDMIPGDHAKNRSILFSKIFNEYLQDWEIDESTRKDGGFILYRL